MEGEKPTPKAAGLWQKTQFANLVRYVPSGVFFARFRVRGKLIRKSLKTDVLSVAELRLSDVEKVERQNAESQTNSTQGKMTFGDALAICRQRITGDLSLKSRSTDYYSQRIAALLKSWPILERTDIRKLTRTECMEWATESGAKPSATAYNNTLKVLRDVLAIGIEAGARYDNPALTVKRASVRPKKLQLPEFSRFEAFVAAIEQAGGRFSKHCANLVRFLAFGGFRISEAANI